MPIDLAENDEEKKATKVVQDMLVQVRDIQAVVSTMCRRTKAPKISAKLGDINPAIYQIGFQQQRDDLTILPAEIQHMIWSHLTYPADRLMLALTCKSHAAVFEQLKGTNAQKSTRTKKPAKIAADSSTSLKSTPAAKKALTKSDRLHVLIQIEPWMPKPYRLCCECLRYLRSRPKGQAKRKMTLASSGTDAWSAGSIKSLRNANEKEISKLLRENLKSGPRCPDCNERARLDTVAAKREHQELKRELAKLM